MRYLAHAVIHCRPVNEDARSTDDMVSIAKQVAASPQRLLALAEQLIATAQQAAQQRSQTPREDVEEVDGGNGTSLPPPTRTAKHKRAQYAARKGEYGKGKAQLA